MNRGLVLRVVILALAAMTINVAAAFVVVWVYSTFVAPGHDLAFYQAFAARAAPISSVIAGIPILFVAGWMAARDLPRLAALRAGFAVAAVYILIDLMVLAATGFAGVSLVIVIASFLTKAASAVAGAAQRAKG